MSIKLGLDRIFTTESFIGASDIKDLEQAAGQFVLYEGLLKRYYPEHLRFLAVIANIKHRVLKKKQVKV